MESGPRNRNFRMPRSILTNLKGVIDNFILKQDLPCFRIYLVKHIVLFYSVAQWREHWGLFWYWLWDLILTGWFCLFVCFLRWSYPYRVGFLFFKITEQGSLKVEINLHSNLASLVLGGVGEPMRQSGPQISDCPVVPSHLSLTHRLKSN